MSRFGISVFALGWVFSLVAMTMIGYLDLVTGDELGFFVFYFIPVALAAWLSGLMPAITIAILSSGMWAGADYLCGHVYSRSFLMVWNTMIRLVSFVIIGWGVWRVSTLLAAEKDLSAKLTRSLAEIHVLEGLLPVCAACKKIRDDRNQWQQMEAYISARSGVTFTHGMCPDCAKKWLEDAGLSSGPVKT